MVEVITRLNEAASVLRRLPEGGQYERPFLTSWPDYKPDPNTAYGYEDAKITPSIPSVRLPFSGWRRSWHGYN